jgi:hypothetical protein
VGPVKTAQPYLGFKMNSMIPRWKYKAGVNIVTTSTLSSDLVHHKALLSSRYWGEFFCTTVMLCNVKHEECVKKNLENREAEGNCIAALTGVLTGQANLF